MTYDPYPDHGSREEVARVALLKARGILPSSDSAPFDIVGDVHGCMDELEELLGKLGYEQRGEGFVHPERRRLVLVGDLVDRGPRVVDVLRMTYAMLQEGRALFVIGNHDFKVLRWLRGHHVRVANGLATTIEQITALPQEEQEVLRERAESMFETAPGYVILDGGRLIVTHGAIRDELIGQWDDDVARLCMYGDVIGYTSHGKPIRRNWAAARVMPEDGSAPWIAYGHTVVERSEWVNRAIDLDTGCVYGGKLTALRYPEMELMQVDAKRQYVARK